MKSIKYTKPDFAADAFEGTAEYYSRYRIPYPKELFDDLIKRSALPAQAKLLDIASGPGRIAVPLAPLFSKVLANDVDAEMIAAGKAEAKKHNVNSIEWLAGKAEELEIESDSIDLITIGEAFHRLDQSIIAELSYRWLKPGGNIAILGCYGILSGNEQWQLIIKELVNKWTPHYSANISAGMDAEHCRMILQDKGFDECKSYSFDFPHYWTFESILGNLYSTSRCSKKVLGVNVNKFETELKSALIKFNDRDKFFENIRFGYTLGKKPLI